MGWAGYDDAWYALPDIGTYYNFNVVDECIYNVFPSGTGEVVSGRVLNSNAGNSPISDVTVTASGGGATFKATTNDKGIYAFKGVASNTTYTLTASKTNYIFSTKSVTTGISSDYSISTGNRWNVDISGMPMGPPNVPDSTVMTTPGQQTKIKLNVTDDGLPNPPGKCYCTIRSLPKYGSLIDCNNNNIINTAPYVLTGYENNVYYQSLNCYDGLDSFTFDANDGGTWPLGGQSLETAIVTINMNASEAAILSVDFSQGLPNGWQIIDGGNDGKTWTTNNPKYRYNVYLDGLFMLVDSDYYKNAELDEQLITPAFSCTRMKNVTVGFSHYFKYYPYAKKEKCDVDVRSNNGPWQNIARWQGATASGDVVLDISQYADRKNNVQVRWHYYDAKYEWYWGIDDVVIKGTPAARMPSDFDYDCNVDWIDFGKFAKSWMTCASDPNYIAICDIAKPCDEKIDSKDLLIFADFWLNGIQ